MTKVLYLIVSGDDAPQKFDVAINTAVRMVENKRFDEFKVLFLGPSEVTMAKATGQRKETIKKLIESGAVDSACVAMAKNSGVEEELKLMGVQLEPYGARLAHYLQNGFQVITF